MALRIATVLRSGGDYDVEYVRRLDAALDACAPGVERICLSDVAGTLQYDWPGWWSKMELFRPDLEGDLLYMDLDTIPVGDLYRLLTACKGDVPIMLGDFYNPGNFGSGLMYLPHGMRVGIWEAWMRSPKAAMENYNCKSVQTWGDQSFLADHMTCAPRRWQDVTPGAVVSYKVHVHKHGCIPHKAKIVCFHGKPRPRAINWELPPPAPKPPWKGQTVFIVGGGPSAKSIDFDLIRDKGVVVAVNDAAMALGWADALFTADMTYVGRRGAFINSFRGDKILAAPDTYIRPNGLVGVEWVSRTQELSMAPMKTITGNSGLSAMVLAIARGAARVVLIGFDMNDGDGSHWFPEYEWDTRLSCEHYPIWVAHMEAISGWAKATGCDIVNVNPGSAIRCFRFAKLEEVCDA